ncbi:MAG: PTS sugar transporter subunit IIA [bacterium]
MKVTTILNEKMILPDLQGTTKLEVINELVDLLKGDERVDDLEELRRAVLDREKIMSTGVGKGFAIPHAKTDAVNDMIAAFGKTTKFVEYEALDEQPVHLVFLLVGKENYVAPHIKLLSRISRMMNKEEFREDLLAAKNAEEIYNIFYKEEEKYLEI